ncbi:MAG: NADPH-dependent 7-cyano-7-deazaguanine reductase QueF [Pseudomonadales bacterium]
MALPSDLPLGKEVGYTSTYTPSLLRGIPRSELRSSMGVKDPLPFRGEDVWNGYEMSWLDSQGKPQVSGLRLHVPCTSAAVIESKSMKLYLNSLSETKFGQRADVLRTLDSDLALAFRSPILVELVDLKHLGSATDDMPGVCLDHLDIFVTEYERNPKLLNTGDLEHVVKETYHTNLFRSLCPVTGQPDWASVMVQYLGPPIDRADLLKYLLSYRSHQAFHEAAIEQIFLDIKARCRPEQLSVFGRFLRRGGLDINPFRSNVEDAAPLIRLSRQ